MRSSILTRSVVAVASVAIGSVALAATPATAAPASPAPNATRDQVLTAVAGVRSTSVNNNGYSASTSRALTGIVNDGCDVRNDENEYAYNTNNIQITDAGDDVVGLLISAQIQRPFGGYDYCTISAFAATNGSYTMSGTATIDGLSFTEDGPEEGTKVNIQREALSGDVFISAPVDRNNPALDQINGGVSASAAGTATKTTKVTTSTKVKDKKSTKEKKAAKAKYDKRIKAAKKSYAKALDKAGSSKSKKSAAKKAYKAKRATAKASYKYATAGFKIVKKSRTVTDAQPFSVTTKITQNNGPQDLSLR